MSQQLLYAEIYRKNAAAPNRAAHFVRACAVEMHINMSQEPLHMEIYRKSAYQVRKVFCGLKTQDPVNPSDSEERSHQAWFWLLPMAHGSNARPANPIIPEP